MQNKEYLRYKEAVENNLDRYLPDTDGKSSLLRKAMMYSVEAGGKRIRPVLLLASCEACGGDIRRAMPFACALEYIHTYSLIHDDHPSMDNDDLRRGVPTNHKVFGDDIAILAGDGLLNSAFDVMLDEIISDDTGNAAKAAREISYAAGVRGMIAGQTADVLMTENRNAGNTDNSAFGGVNDYIGKYGSREMLAFIHRNKTGALIRAAVRAGALIAGAEDNVLDALTGYAEALGMAFQIVDDILDIAGDEAAMGKRTGADDGLGKMTYPAVYGFDAACRKADEVTGEALHFLEKSGLENGFLKKMAIDLAKRIS